MIQYLQSWFPGWGGWYGESQDADRSEELLTSSSSWDILGKKICGGMLSTAHKKLFALCNFKRLSFCNPDIVSIETGYMYVGLECAVPI